jgi:hypothetical protein
MSKAKRRNPSMCFKITSEEIVEFDGRDQLLGSVWSHSFRDTIFDVGVQLSGSKSNKLLM